MTSVPTDEIYERYLQKAIAEANELGHEIAAAGGGARVPVLGSGHPLADVMLLKFAPQPSEVQEGVAFFGRTGQAILKSLQRLHVDPLAVYGTNCLKFADGSEDEGAPWLLRELHIVQPKLVVVMGEQALAFLNALEFPLSEAVEDRPGELQRYTPTVAGARDAGHRRLPRRATSEDALLERVQSTRPLVGRASALLGEPGGTLLVVGVCCSFRGKDAGSVRMRSYTGATEDAASGRAARPGGTALFRQALLTDGRPLSRSSSPRSPRTTRGASRSGTPRCGGTWPGSRSC